MVSVALNDEYLERVYAAILGKIVGVYLGRPVEGWPYDDIRSRVGAVDRYVNVELGVPLVVADDDISGTLAFARAVLDADPAEPAHAARTQALEPVGAAAVGRTWLNYVIENRTILWWGGYGRSTEHTAFLNLRRGLDAPASGSIANNGATLAEQIGAQIFSDAFALMHPGDPEAAVALTRAAASVSHDGVALDAAGYLAAMRADAFVTADLDALFERNRFAVHDPRLLKLIDDVLGTVSAGDDWREVRNWLDRRYGYARYPGPCHALANTAVVLAALRLGGDDFGRATMVAASVGFDTDSNAGTVGCLTATRLGLAALDQVPHLRTPVADRMLVVSADGGECVTDAVREARKIYASALSRRGLDSAQAARSAETAPRFDFSRSGSTQGFTPCPYSRGAADLGWIPLDQGSLQIGPTDAEAAEVSTPVFLDPRETADHFSCLASPTLYPTDTVRIVARGAGAVLTPYVLYRDGDTVHRREIAPAVLTAEPTTVEWEVPVHQRVVPFRLGLSVPPGSAPVSVSSIDWTGAPRAFVQQGVLLSSIWDTQPSALSIWVSSANNFEADFASTFSVSHPGRLGLVTTGTRSWTDYAVSSSLTLSLHATAGLAARARGHRRFLAGVLTKGRLQLIRQHDEQRTVLGDVAFDAPLDRPITMRLTVVGPQATVVVDTSTGARSGASSTAVRLRVDDVPIAGGAAGFLVEDGTFAADGFAVHRL